MPAEPNTELVRDGELSIRTMRGDDADLQQILVWRREPHVRATWDNDDDDGEMTFEDVLRHYGPEADPAEVTTQAFIELNGRPIGYIQFYPWRALRDEAIAMSIPLEGDPWGLDVFIGDPRAVDRGHGSHAVDLLCRYLFDVQDATGVAVLTEETNVQAQRAYEKAGFRKLRRALDLDTRGGERIPCWLMIREA